MKMEIKKEEWLKKLKKGDRIIHKLIDTKHEKGIRMWRERIEDIKYLKEERKIAIEVFPSRCFSQETGYNIYKGEDDLTRWIDPEGEEEEKYFIYEDILPVLQEAEELIAQMRKYITEKKIEEMDKNVIKWVASILKSISKEEEFNYEIYKILFNEEATEL